MTATNFVSTANQIIFIVVFAVTVIRAMRLRTAPSLDIAVFFGLIVLAQQLRNLFHLLGMGDSLVATKLPVVVIPWLPYLLLRLTDHFSPQRRWFMVAALLVAIAVIVVGLASPVPLPTAVAAVLVGWFVLGGGYASVAFVRGAQRSPGVTARRMTAAAIGSGLLATALLLALLGLVVPAGSELTGILSQLAITGAGIAYYVGFATPTWLRRAWQEPAMRSFLAHSAELTREADETTMRRRLERLAAEAMGVPSAAIGLSSADGSSLRWLMPDGHVSETPSDRYLAGRAFTEQRPVFSRNPAADDPENADAYREAGINALMAAPMELDGRRYGVLLLYAPRTPLFAYSDLNLTSVLAQQAAGILESRQLLREAAEVQAREVAARAKEDFLSAAAHDLRTPLASMVLRAELLKKRMERDGSPHLEAIGAVVSDAARVTEFVNDLLDAARADQGRLSTSEERVDLAAVARDAVEQARDTDHEIVVTASEAWVVGDARRLRQVIDNLISNAQKYSPDGGRIDVAVTADDGEARVSVRDRGIGIGAEDMPNLFQRFSRGHNVDDRRFSGMGLGLYICRRIVEEHGGHIHAESELGVGTTMQFAIPSARREEEAPHG